MEAYIFRAEDQTTETLWNIIREREELALNGSIGDCTLRRIAEKESSELYYYTVMNMELVASRAAYELLKRLDPSQFEETNNG